MPNGTTVLVDADIVAFAAACVAEGEIAWDEEVVSGWADLATAKRVVEDHINMIQADCNATYILLAFSDHHNFRYGVLPTYKHNRAAKEPPTLLGGIREWMKTEWSFRVIPRLEADDVLGIMATSMPRTIVASIDKDLLQIPGRHYNWRSRNVYTVGPNEADWWFWRQVLTGDSVDGFKGIPGVGPVKAEKLLNEVPWYDREYAVALAYMDRCLSRDYFLSQVRVARILRAGEWCERTGRIKLWEMTV
jgi:DNA polymerase-1